MCGEVCAACRGYVQDNRKVCAMPWPRQDSKNDERGYMQICAKGMCGYVRICVGMCGRGHDRCDGHSHHKLGGAGRLKHARTYLITHIGPHIPAHTLHILPFTRTYPAHTRTYPHIPPHIPPRTYPHIPLHIPPCTYPLFRFRC